jgi:hypothetical protein
MGLFFKTGRIPVVHSADPFGFCGLLAAISGPLIGGAAETLFGWKGIITGWLIICGIAVMITALLIDFSGTGKTAYRR